MLNYIWGFMMILSVVCALVTGKIENLSSSILNGASSAVQTIISIVGMMCLFTGLMKIADQSGVTKTIAKIFSPVISKLFPDYDKNSPAMKSVCMNLTANLLGLGNAATPLGIKAMKEMSKQLKDPLKANNSMIMFVILNTASLQLVPTMMSGLRQSHGSDRPFEVLPAIWMTSLFALFVGISVAKLLEKKGSN